MTHQDAQALKAWIEANGGKTDIRYNLRDVDTHNRVAAYDVKVFYNNNWYLVADAIAKKAADDAAAKKAADDVAIKAVADKVAAATKEAEYKKENAATIKTEVEGLMNEYKGLSEDQKKDPKADKVKEDINKKVEAYNALEGVAEADKLAKL